MPILACRCKACGKSFDYLQSGRTDDPICPECRSAEVDRLLAPFAVSAGSAKSAAPAECSGDPSSCGRCGCGGGFAA